MAPDPITESTSAAADHSLTAKQTNLILNARPWLRLTTHQASMVASEEPSGGFYGRAPV
jgi:hypothetical protein